jgi:hypothetical protein
MDRDILKPQGHPVIISLLIISQIIFVCQRCAIARHRLQPGGSKEGESLLIIWEWPPIFASTA